MLQDTDQDFGANNNSKITRQVSKQILWVLFLFLYIPLLYYRGLKLAPGIGIDYPSFFEAARIAFLEGRTPYGAHVFDGIPGFMGGQLQPYIYPPPSLLAFWPLIKLRPEDAQVAFTVVSHLCCLGSIWLILFKLTPLPKNQRLRELTIGVSLIYMLSVNAVPDTFGNGQINFMALLFICLAMTAFRKNSAAWLIALPLSIAILLKTYPVFLLLPLLFHKRFKPIVLTCLFFAGFTALTYVVLPKDVWHTWWAEVVPLGAYANNAFPAAFCWNQSINAFVMRLFQEEYFSKAPLYYPALAKPVATGLALLVIGTTTFYSYWSSRAADPDASKEDEIAAYLLMSYLVAPLSWDHHLVYVLPAAVLAISLLIRRAVRGAPAVIILGSVLLIAWRFPIDRPDIVTGWWTLLLSAKLYPVVILWLLFIRRLSQSRVTSFHSTDASQSTNVNVLRPAEAGIA